MCPDVLIIGQGLAGTMLAWELERAGIAFTIVDQGHTTAATWAAAGIINPITGRRLVKSWRIDELLPAARVAYQAFERAHGAPIWREMRVRRLFADDRERNVFAQKHATGELAPFSAAGDEHGFWVQGAVRVDLRTMISMARARWRKMGRLRESICSLERELEQHDRVIDCSGTAAARAGGFSFVPWECSKGEMIEVNVSAGSLDPEVVINCGHWVLPVAPETAWVGATHDPGAVDATPTTKGRAALEASAAKLIRGAFRVVAQRAGIRVNLPDKRPVAGSHPGNPRLGIINGLGAKGALWAPMLARQWGNHLVQGVPFEREIDVQRFAR
jgi:glycine oxidase